MSPTEALTVTVLGLAVVFTGLLLCLLCMALLARVAGRVAVAEAHGPTPPSSSGRARAVTPDGPVPDDVLAVIVAVLEVERALYVGRYRSRMTLRRSAPGVSSGGGEAP